jgi:hypothetical protein
MFLSDGAVAVCWANRVLRTVGVSAYPKPEVHQTMSLVGRGCVKTLGVQFELFILATYVRFRTNYCARVDRYRTYGLSRLSFYTASAG